MSGYYRNGEWHSVALVTGKDAGGAEQAVQEANKRVEEGLTSARAEMKQLLQKHPSLRQDRENHPLKTLAGYFALEAMK